MGERFALPFLAYKGGFFAAFMRLSLCFGLKTLRRITHFACGVLLCSIALYTAIFGGVSLN